MSFQSNLEKLYTMNKSNFEGSLMPWLLSIAAIFAIGALIDRLLGIKKLDLEPPFLPSKIPYFGHAIGIVRKGVPYYESLTKRYGKKTFSLAMPGGRLYIFNSADHVSAIQKSHRDLSLWVIQAEMTNTLGGLSKQASAICAENARGEKDQPSFAVEVLRSMHTTMAGKNLDDLTRQAIGRINQDVRILESRAASGESVNLWRWAQHATAMGISRAIYGPANPYEDPVIEKSLLVFSDNIQQFMTGLPGWIFYRKPYYAREAIVSTFEKYYQEGEENRSSEMLQVRTRITREYGVGLKDIARIEAMNSFGIVLNILPTAFWTLWHIYSNPDLLKSIREEAQAALGDNPELNDDLDISVVDRLPLTQSVMFEALRYHSAGAAMRQVMDDVTVDGKFRLKKDSYCLIPIKGVHYDQDTWGQDVATFKPTRFLKGVNKVPSVAFRGFGGGVNVCPGKAVATRIISIVVASIVLRFDFQPESGEWEFPGDDYSNLVAALAHPNKEIPVKVVARN